MSAAFLPTRSLIRLSGRDAQEFLQGLITTDIEGLPAGEARPGALLALSGPLGAGKTQLAKGVGEGLGVTSVVNSPTFVLMNEHPGRLRLFHIDAYRLDDPEEAIAAGLIDDRQAAGMTVVEWADRLDGYLPDDRLEIELLPDDEASERRTLRWRAMGPNAARLAEAFDA